MLFGTNVEGQAGRPRVVIHPDGTAPPDKRTPHFQIDPQEWDVIDEFTIIHRAMTPRKK